MVMAAIQMLNADPVIGRDFELRFLNYLPALLLKRSAVTPALAYL
jgi:hypothetical protein